MNRSKRGKTSKKRKLKTCKKGGKPLKVRQSVKKTKQKMKGKHVVKKVRSRTHSRSKKTNKLRGKTKGGTKTKKSKKETGIKSPPAPLKGIVRTRDKPLTREQIDALYKETNPDTGNTFGYDMFGPRGNMQQ